jgi:Ca2+-binding EF-hand superfamily protein
MLKKSLMLAASTVLILGASAYANEGATTTTKKGTMFEQSDTNSDGAISKEEFLANAEKRFSKIDANNDGKLTKEEFKAHREARKGKMKEKRATRKGSVTETKTNEPK